jgi:hypothetical protein
MKAAIIFTGTGPLLILTSYPSFDDPSFLTKLKAKGIRKFISCEVPIEQCEDLYDYSYRDIVEDLQRTNDMRVLDYGDHPIFNNFSLKRIGCPFIFEE